MLEVVGIQFAGSQLLVRQDVVVELDDVQLDAGILGQVLVDVLEDLGLRNRAGTDLQFHRVCRIQGGAGLGSGRGATAGGQCEQGGDAGQGQYKFLTHDLRSLSFGPAVQRIPAR